MVRVVNIDEAVRSIADQALLQQNAPEVGLLVGRQTTGKDLVLQIVPTPYQDGQPPIEVTAVDARKSKSPSSSPQIRLDEEWIVEHAAQMVRILPGGLNVLGVYVMCMERAFQTSHSVLVKTLKAVQQEADPAGKINSAPLALHIDSSTAKLSARETEGTTLRPCEVKVSNLTCNMAALACEYALKMHVGLASGKQYLHGAIRAAIALERKQRLEPAVGIIRGQIPLQDTQVLDMMSEGGEDDILTMELLVPIGCAPDTLGCVGDGDPAALAPGKGEYECCGVLELTGILDCRAYVHKRESVMAAMDALKEDIERTLLARLNVLVEAAEMAEAAAREDAEERASKGVATAAKPLKHPLLTRAADVRPYRCGFPRRAFVPWHAGGGCYCDFLIEGEGLQEIVHRLGELVGTSAVDAAAFQCREKAACGPKEAKAGQRQRSSMLTSCNLMLLGAIGVATLAAIYALSGS